MNKDLYGPLERILEAQLLLCEAEGTNPDDEPFIQQLRDRIKELESNEL